MKAANSGEYTIEIWIAFAGMFGHGQDAALLEFAGEPIQQAPKVSF